MLKSSGETGLKDFRVRYIGAEEAFTDQERLHMNIPRGKYINGMRAKTDDPSGKITRLDFLLGGTVED